MKQTPTTYATVLSALSNGELLSLALSGNRDAQRAIEGGDAYKYGRPEVTPVSEFNEEARLDIGERVRDMHSAGRL